MASGKDLVRAEDDKLTKERPPYFRYAFHNVYNYTLLGGFAAAALLTGNWWLAVVGAGIEALWMVFGPDSKLLRKLYFDKVHEENLTAQEEAVLAEQIGRLPAADQQRYRALLRKHHEIQALCGENRAFTQDLLATELDKLSQLQRSFLDLMLSSAKHNEYLAKIDFDELEADMERHRGISEKAKDEDRRHLAAKNLEVLTQRREKLAEIRRFVSRAQGQMDLIENTFRLLADQIVTMQSPRELGSQLDELITGVEAVRTTARETEAWFQAVAQ